MIIFNYGLVARWIFLSFLKWLNPVVRRNRDGIFPLDTVIKNGKFSTIILFDDKRVRCKRYWKLTGIGMPAAFYLQKFC